MAEAAQRHTRLRPLFLPRNLAVDPTPAPRLPAATPPARAPAPGDSKFLSYVQKRCRLGIPFPVEGSLPSSVWPTTAWIVTGRRWHPLGASEKGVPCLSRPPGKTNSVSEEFRGWQCDYSLELLSSLRPVLPHTLRSLSSSFLFTHAGFSSGQKGPELFRCLLPVQHGFHPSSLFHTLSV